MNPYFGFSSNEKQRRAWTQIAIKRVSLPSMIVRSLRSSIDSIGQTQQEGYYPARELQQGHDLPAVRSRLHFWLNLCSSGLIPMSLGRAQRVVRMDGI